MKITIDTKEDSHDEIRKIIKVLSSLVGEETFTNQGDVFENKEGLNQNIFDGFGKQDTTEKQSKEAKPKDDKELDIDLEIPELEEYN